MEPLAQVFARDSRIAYALLFGSAARGTSHVASDVDIAVGLRPGVALTASEIGSLIAVLELASGRSVDLVLTNDMSPAITYRVFRDGVPILVQDKGLLAERKARAILDYLDFRPLEELAARGVLLAASRC